MRNLNRRQWLGTLGAAFVAGGDAVARGGQDSSPRKGEMKKMPLELSDFQPRSMLHVPETHVPRSRFPVIDVHAHLSFTARGKNGVPLGEKMKYPAPRKKSCRSWTARTSA